MYMMRTKSEGGNATLDSKYVWRENRDRHKKAGQPTIWPTNQNPSYENTKDYVLQDLNAILCSALLLANVYMISLLPVYIVESIE